MTKRIAILLSGGLDSTVLVYDRISQGDDVICLGFDYGQTHSKELGFAESTCKKLNVPFTRIELHRIKNLFLRCALTDGAGSVIVPNRNAILLNIAAAMAIGSDCEEVHFGATAEDYDGFPDCRPEWLLCQNEALATAKLNVRLVAPYISISKRKIVELGRELFVDFKQTWSCYAGGNRECGKCDACKKRKEALK